MRRIVKRSRKVLAGDIAAAQLCPEDNVIHAIRCATKPQDYLDAVWSFPGSVISVAVEPDEYRCMEKMGVALLLSCPEDPCFKSVTDEESVQTIILRYGVKLHLIIIVDRMRREFSV